MIFQQHFPQSLTRTRLDRYLADGWFRCQDFLYRSKLVSFDGDLYSVVNIRLPLQSYRPSKTMRRILRRNQPVLRHEFGAVHITPDKERLYEEHKLRFKGRILPSLHDYLFGESNSFLFDTRELCVYDGDKLIAVSFFDQGRDSVASLLGLYDQNYKRNSLGNYTMLLEIEYAKQAGKRYYYPGYIVDESDIFDYKLRIGELEYYDWHGQWMPLPERVEPQTVAQVLKDKTAQMEQCLAAYHIPFEKRLYAYFSMGYLEEETFVKGAILLMCLLPGRQGEQMLVEYDLEENAYILSFVYSVAFEEMEDIIFAEASDTKPLYCFDLLAYEEILCYAYSPEEIAEAILANS